MKRKFNSSEGKPSEKRKEVKRTAKRLEVKRKFNSSEGKPSEKRKEVKRTVKRAERKKGSKLGASGKVSEKKGPGKRTVKKDQAKKSVWRMPWHQEPKKDVVSCEKLWGVASKRRSIDIRMGKPGGRKVPSLYTESIGIQREPGELKHLSSRRRGNQPRFSK